MANAKLYLDARALKKDGTAPVKILLTHRGTKTYMPTGISIEPKQWNAATCRMTSGARRSIINATLDSKLRSVENVLESLPIGRNARIKDAKELCQIVLDGLAVEDGSSPAAACGDFYESYRAFLDIKENGRTKEIYRATWRALEKYVGVEGAKDLSFADITKQWLMSFYAWLGHTSPSVNARNIHLRNIRAVFNNAIDNEVTTLYPFRRMSIRPALTRKRNLAPDVLRGIIFGTGYDEWQQKYIDVFTLSFLLIGINVGDLLSLRPEDYADGRIRYVRKKTHKPYDIKVEPEAAAIIAKYGGGKHLLNVIDKYVNYKDFAARLNKCLKSIHAEVTTYWARHSWATIAASLDVPKDTIAEALGHARNTVTDVYIEFDHRKVDEANRRVIDFIYNEKGGIQ